MRRSEDFKKERVFEKQDVILYVAVIVLIAVVCLAVFLPRKELDLAGAEIYYGDSVVYEYSFLKGKGTITDKGEGLVSETEEDGKILVTVVTDKGRNVVEIGKDYIKMAEADCSKSHDCMQFSPLKKGGGSIVCLPNEIKIVSSGEMPDEVKI